MTDSTTPINQPTHQPNPRHNEQVRNEKARRFLANMRKKGGTFEQLFAKIEPRARALLKRLLAFDPADRPSAEEALADPYFANLHSPAREPSAQAISKVAFEFERRKLAIDDVRELIYREILEYHPQVSGWRLAVDWVGSFRLGLGSWWGINCVVAERVGANSL